MCLCVPSWHTYGNHSTPLWSQFSLSTIWALESNSGHWTWWQAPFSSESFCKSWFLALGLWLDSLLTVGSASHFVDTMLSPHGDINQASHGLHLPLFPFIPVSSVSPLLHISHLHPFLSFTGDFGFLYFLCVLWSLHLVYPLFNLDFGNFSNVWWVILSYLS